MVAVKVHSRSRRLVTHYVLLAFAAFLLCGTILLVQKPTTFIGVRAHSAHDVLTKPHLIYGTAWKKEATAGLVYQAVKTGFRYIDTACQPKHYNEPGVGDGWTAAAQELGLTRQDLWLQTKFTPIGGQDPERIPYDKDKPIDQQAEESLQVSLKNLKTDYLDSWVLHSSPGSFEDLMKVWRVMERAVDDQQVLSIGISNIYDFETFQSLYEEARHKPKFLQNRFTSRTNFDTKLRRFCQQREIKYQSFWTLTANREALATQEVQTMAQAKGLTPQTYMFAFLMSLGHITPLSGTTDKVHMAEDVAVMERMQGGESMFTKQEQEQMAHILKMPMISLHKETEKE